jgi:hypothetical protein
MSMTFTGKGVDYFILCSQIGAIKLEALGMRHSSGRSVTAHCKRIYGLKGSREKVLAAMEAKREEMLEERRREQGD